MKNEKIKIAIIDDDFFMEDVIRSILENKSQGTIELHSYYKSVKEFYSKSDFQDIDVILVDMNINGDDRKGLEILDFIGNKNNITSKTVILSGYVFSQAIIDEAKRKGANYYLPKKLMNELLVKVIECTYYNKPIDDFFANYHLKFYQLTPKEKEVFINFSMGKIQSVIADELKINTTTVERHLTEIRKKFNIQTDVMFAIIAIRLRIPEVIDYLNYNQD